MEYNSKLLKEEIRSSGRNIYNFFILLGFLSIISCSPEPDIYQQKWKKFEQDYDLCFKSEFLFPNDSIASDSQFLKCNLNGNEILISDAGFGFVSSIYFRSEFITHVPNAPITGVDASKTSVMIFFLEPGTFRYIGLIVPFPEDSLNYTVQQIFSKPFVPLLGNFEQLSPSLEFNVNCSEVNYAVNFSTVYSATKDQKISVDSFHFELVGDKWQYHLEYSCNSIEVTNVAWNANSKTNRYGEQLESNILIENLSVRDLKCSIDFFLPND